jgi:hypothetical protein
MTVAFAGSPSLGRMTPSPLQVREAAARRIGRRANREGKCRFERIVSE